MLGLHYWEKRGSHGATSAVACLLHFCFLFSMKASWSIDVEMTLVVSRQGLKKDPFSGGRGLCMWEGWIYPLLKHMPLGQDVITKAFCTNRRKVKMIKITVKIILWNPSILTLEGTLEPMESSPIVLYMKRNRGLKSFVLRVAQPVYWQNTVRTWVSRLLHLGSRLLLPSIKHQDFHVLMILFKWSYPVPTML